MTFEMGEETREVQGTWDISTYNYLVDGAGIKLLVDSMKAVSYTHLTLPTKRIV